MADLWQQPERWKGSCESQWPVFVVAAEVVIFGVITAFAPVMVFGLISVLSVAPLILAFRRLEVTVSAGGVKLAYGLRGWPRQCIDLSDIVAAKVERATWRTGGIGYRGSLRLFKQTKVIVRHGECLRLQLVRGRCLWVSVDEANGAVAALADLGIET